VSPKEERESWARYQKVILSELSNHAKTLEDLTKALKENTSLTSDMRAEQSRISEALRDLPEMRGRLNCMATDVASVQTEVKNLSGESDRIDKLETAHGALSREVGEQKIAAGFWGSLSGAITGVVTALTLYFTGGGK
jgi:chromosome segregation ATPase